MPIYDSNNVEVTKYVKSALSRPDVIEIKNRTLDGQYHIQTIGTAGTIVDVVANFTIAQKLVFDNLKRTTSTIRIVFDGRYYTGIIDGDPSCDRIASMTGTQFTISFSLLVVTEGVA